MRHWAKINHTLDNIISFQITYFFRPFTSESWYAICTLTLGSILVQLSLHVYAEKISLSPESSRVYLFMLWFFFFVINSYYGGAMTMFFSSERTTPFSTLREGLNLYPEWKLVFTEVYKDILEMR